MVFSTPNLLVTSEHGTATLWLRFPGQPTNALDLDRLGELERALATIEASPSIRVLVLRSGLPTGFCEGLSPTAVTSLETSADAASFAWFGQRVLGRLAQLEIPTIAFLEGAALDAGLELALACDYRLAVAHPRAPLGFPGRRTCFGGLGRFRSLAGRRADEILRSGCVVSAREAKTLGFIDDAFCERRAKIELRSFLDKLERWPCKPRRFSAEHDLATERASFAQAISQKGFAVTARPNVTPPRLVGIASSSPLSRQLAADFAVQGSLVKQLEIDQGLGSRIEEWRARGFLTPLEARQAHARVSIDHSAENLREAEVVFVSHLVDAISIEQTLNPRGILVLEHLTNPWLASFRYPQRVVGFRGEAPRRVTLTVDASRFDAIGLGLASWLEMHGLRVRLVHRGSIRTEEMPEVTPSRALVAA